MGCWLELESSGGDDMPLFPSGGVPEFGVGELLLLFALS